MEIWQIIGWWAVAGLLIAISALLAIRAMRKGEDAGDVTAYLFVAILCCLIWPFTFWMVIHIAAFSAMVAGPIWLLHFLLPPAQQKDQTHE